MQNLIISITLLALVSCSGINDNSSYDVVTNSSHIFTFEELESMGFKISIGKPLLRIKKLENVINSTNINNIIVETDSAPQPFKKNRSKWTEPKDCNLIIDKISKIKCENIENTTEHIFNNTFNMLKNGSNWLMKEHLSYGII